MSLFLIVALPFLGCPVARFDEFSGQERLRRSDFHGDIGGAGGSFDQSACGAGGRCGDGCVSTGCRNWA